MLCFFHAPGASNIQPVINGSSHTNLTADLNLPKIDLVSMNLKRLSFNFQTLMQLKIFSQPKTKRDENEQNLLTTVIQDNKDFEKDVLQNSEKKKLKDDIVFETTLGQTGTSRSNNSITIQQGQL